MPFELTKKPTGARLIEGFPGFGLVGTITTEYLLKHLNCECIGQLVLDELPPTVVIHEGKLVKPISLYYNKGYNLLILHALSAGIGVEWKITAEITKLVKDLNIKEIISIEGVSSNEANPPKSRTFVYSSNDDTRKKLKKIAPELSEGIIMGVTAALLVNSNVTTTAIFADSASNLPDSKAAAAVITVLDQYLGLKIDPKPLLETAKEFEEKLKSLMQQNITAQKEAEKKKMSYVG